MVADPAVRAELFTQSAPPVLTHSVCSPYMESRSYPPPPPAVASLAHMRLLYKVSSDEQLDVMRMRCEAPADMLARVAAAIKFDLRNYVSEFGGS